MKLAASGLLRGLLSRHKAEGAPGVRIDDGRPHIPVHPALLTPAARAALAPPALSLVGEQGALEEAGVGHGRGRLDAQGEAQPVEGPPRELEQKLLGARAPEGGEHHQPVQLGDVVLSVVGRLVSKGKPRHGPAHRVHPEGRERHRLPLGPIDFFFFSARRRPASAAADAAGLAGCNKPAELVAQGVRVGRRAHVVLRSISSLDEPIPADPGAHHILE
mmetsp:Transcript_50838/g.115446  ORF Transcript_50838/g.115446 Transcript_50838/m.115446 type:complete len:218 (+) Transcript_50838:202-855(+)